MGGVRPILAVVAGILAWGALSPPQAATGSSDQTSFSAKARPFFQKYCFTCHSSRVKAAGFDLQQLVEELPRSQVLRHREWELVGEQLYARAMPPGVAPQPSVAERQQMTRWIDGQLDSVDLSAYSDAGEPVMRRLTRAEFQNTIRDLTGLDLDFGRYLTADAVSQEGLPNNVGNLFFSGEQLEKLMQAEDSLLQHASFSPTRGLVFSQELPPVVRQHEKLQDAATDLASFYFPLLRSEIEQNGEAIPRFFVAAWELRNIQRAATAQEVEAIARKHRVNGEALDRLFKYLGLDYLALSAGDGKDKSPREFTEYRSQFEPAFKLFQSLPVAHNLKEASAALPAVKKNAQEFAELIERLSATIDHSIGKSNSDHSHPFDINVSKADVVYLKVAPVTSVNTNDFGTWLDGKFRMANGSELPLSQSERIEGVSADGRVATNTDSHGGPLHVFTQGLYTDVRRKLYTHPESMNRSNPEYADNTIAWNQAYSVQAPSLLAFRVPKGATRFTVRGALQDLARALPTDKRREWWQDGVAQFFVTTQKPANIEAVPGAQITFATGVQTGAIGALIAAADKFFTPYFPSPAQWIVQATDHPGQTTVKGVFNLPPERLAVVLSSRLAEKRAELLRRNKEYLLLSSEPTFLKSQIASILYGERHDLQIVVTDRLLSESEVRERSSPAAKKEIVRLEGLLASAQKELRDAAEKQLAAFAEKAFRRPPTPAEVERILRLYDHFMDDPKSTTEEGVKFAASSVLISPSFLYISEPGVAGSEPAPLAGYGLASRLSYFLWSSTPDGSLLAAAKNRRLENSELLWKETQRMVADKRSSALVDQFFGYSLGFRRIRQYDEVNRTLFPQYTESLRESMYQETALFIEDLIRNDRSILKLLDADYTFLNEELARHYGIPGVEGPAFRRVTLPANTERGGILGMASILTLTSKPARTSPVDRGVYVLRYILGTPPPPPPASVSKDLDRTAGANATPLSLRQRLEAHRNNASCAVCHRRMDPIGFALEKFDPIGRYRAENPDVGGLIDTRGTLPNGTEVASEPELSKVLISGREKQTFVKTFCRQLLCYALGRSLTYHDLATERAMIEALQQNDYRFSAAVRVIVESSQFRHQSADTLQSRSGNSRGAL